MNPKNFSPNLKLIKFLRSVRFPETMNFFRPYLSSNAMTLYSTEGSLAVVETRLVHEYRMYIITLLK